MHPVANRTGGYRHLSGSNPDASAIFLASHMKCRHRARVQQSKSECFASRVRWMDDQIRRAMEALLMQDAKRSSRVYAVQFALP
jgi:hypothetical protein